MLSCSKSFLRFSGKSMAGTATKNTPVKIHEVTKITPFFHESSTAGEYHLPLTLFDTFWLKFLPVERIFFYEIDHGLDWDLFSSQILPNLKHSLCLALGLHYLPLAGHITWSNGKPVVRYSPSQNDGLSFTVAEYRNAGGEDDGLLFNHLSGNGIREAVQYHPLVPQLSITDDQAEVVAVQITLFPKQGFCIGISNHHAFFDGKSTIMFVRSWASICKQLLQSQQDVNNPSLPLDLIPSFDRTVVVDPKEIDMVYVNNWVDFTGDRSLKVIPSLTDVDKLLRATFLLTRADIQMLREKIMLEYNSNADDNKNKKLHLSTFVLTCAYVYTCLIKTKGGDTNRDVVLTFTADYRARLDPPVPKNYFGNCVGACRRTIRAVDFVEPTGGLAYVAQVLSEMVEEIGDGLSTVDDDELKDKLVKIISAVKHMKEHGTLLFGVAGSPRFGVYGSDFGWGKPKKVEIVSVDHTGAVALADSRDGDGGVEIGVVLEKPQMEIFASSFQDGLQNLW